MIYLLSHFWAWWLSAFAVGVATALSIGGRPERGWVADWLVWFVLACLVGAPVAYLQLLAGRPGFWLETALTLFGAFLVGCGLGALLAGRSLREHEGWAVGLIPLALIWLGVDALAGRAFENDLKRRAASAVEKVGGDPAYLDVKGRDVLLPRDAANRAEAEEAIAGLPGVRRVVDVDGLTGPAAKAYQNAQIARRAARGGETPPAAVPAPAPHGGKKRESSTAASPPVPTPAPVATPGATRPAESETPAEPAPRGETPPTGEIDAEACQRAVAETLAGEPIRFQRGGAGIRRVSTGVLGRVIADLGRCPSAKVAVRSYAEGADRAAHRLARQRAERLVDYLSRMGVDRARLSVAGQGEPVSKDEAGGGAKRGIELDVRPPG
jgi:outer membrane protein OmpA-like peptidoglycan-associated protein